VELEHEFTVPVGVEEAWAVLRDIERIGPCMPGATIESVEGEHFTGSVKVKVGPITVRYHGEADFVDVDEAGHAARIEAKGKETKGSGTARATVSAALESVDDGTRVRLVTDLAVTGKPAQFGRGVMADVGTKLIGQFADCLSSQLAGPGPEAVSAAPGADAGAVAGDPGAADAGEPVAAVVPVAVPEVSADELPTPASTATPPPPADRPPTRPVPRPTDDAIDLLGVAGAPVAKRLAPAAGVAAVLAVVWWLVRRRRR